MPRMTRKTKPVQNALWSWRADRKARKGHIQEAIRLALEDKKTLAESTSSQWQARQCGYMIQWADRNLTKSLKQLARDHLEYWRLRAFMPGAYPDWPGDKPAHEKWELYK